MPGLFMDASPLRESRDFRLLFSGQLVSMFGSQLTIVAVAIQVYDATHSSFWTGAVSFFQLPFLVGGSLYGGARGDRGDRRPLLYRSTLVLSLFSAGLAINAQVAGSRVAVVMALSVAASGLVGFSNAARSAAIPRLVRQEQLVGAYSINQTVIQIGAVLGPGAAGLLIGLASLSICYWIDAGSFLLLAGATFAMKPIPPLGAPSQGTIWGSIKEGFAYVKSHHVAQSVYLVDLNAMIFGMPTSLFPMIATHWYHGGPITVGLLYAAPGVGALIGAVTTGWVAHVVRRGRAVIFAVVLWGLAIVGFGVTPLVVVGVACLALAGWADVISAILRNTILQTTITDDYRGRLSAIQMAVVQGGPRLGNFEAGAVATAVSGGFSVVSGGLLSAVGAVGLALWRPKFWREQLAD